jgi:hypothetical protein
MLRQVSMTALLFTLCCGAAAPSVAQTTNGVIAGIISDAQGGVLPGVTVTGRNLDTGISRTVVTEADGRYRLASLPPGRYELKSEIAGFASADVPALTLTTGTEVTRNITMQLQGVQEAVTVSGEAPIVEVTKSEVSGIITQQQMEMLPLATRQPMDLALLMPGTSQDAIRPRKSNSNIGAGGFTNGSGLLVDGVWNKEANTGEPRQDFPQSAIREFKVFLSQSPAEYGWTAGGTVSMATKSGTNKVSGEAFEYFRTKALNTMDPFAAASGQAKPDFSRHQFGGAAGGPLVKDKIHFFQAAEGLQSNLNDTVVVRLPQFYGNLNGTFPSPEYNHMSFTRADVQATPNQSFFLRYGWQVSDFTCEGCSASSSTPWFTGAGIKQVRYALAGAHTWVLSPRVLNEVRGQYVKYLFRQHAPGVEPTGEIFEDSPARATALTPVFSFPTLTWGTSSHQYGDQWARQLRDDLSVTTGQHTWKVGVGFLDMPIDQDVRKQYGAWTFSVDQPFNPSNLASFVPVPGSVRLFTTALLNVPLYAQNHYWDAYVEDEWKPTSGLTLNLGLRYDLQTRVFNEDRTLDDRVNFPTTGTATSLAPLIDFSTRGDKNNFGPRVGLAWDVKNDGHTVVRTGYGLYFNPVLSQLELAEINNYRQLTATIQNPTYPDPYGGRDPVTFVSSAVQNVAVNANNLENLQSAAYTGGVSQGLTSTLALHVDGVYTKITKAAIAIDINPRANGATGARPRPQFGRVLQNQSIGFMDYKALLVRLEKRLEHNYMFNISYTLANSDGNVNNSGGFSSQITDSAHLLYDVGPSQNDRRNTLVASGTVLLPYGINLGGVFTYRSTLPFSAIAGVDLNGDGVVTDFVPGTTRNALNRDNNDQVIAAVNQYRAASGLAPISASQIDTNDYANLDVRASKSMPIGGTRIEIIGQVFNLLNRTNLAATWTTNALSSSFGTITGAANKRQAEVAVRVSF